MLNTNKNGISIGAEVEEQLHLVLNDDLYPTLFESNHQVLLVFDLPSVNFLLVNRAAEELYKWTREEFFEEAFWICSGMRIFHSCCRRLL